MHLWLLSHYFFVSDCKFKIGISHWFFCAKWKKYFKCVQMIVGKMIKIIKRPHAPLHFVLEAKRATQILLGRMRKSLDFVLLRRIWIKYWTTFLHSRITPLWNMSETPVKTFSIPWSFGHISQWCYTWMEEDGPVLYPYSSQKNGTEAVWRWCQFFCWTIPS